MKKIFSSGLLVLLASVIFASGCKGTKALLPNVSGKACEIMVVIDKDYWEGPLGDEVRLVLADEVPYLPQREPLFNLSNVPLSGFSDLFRVHRNIMLLQVDPQIDSVGIFFHKDVWASPQSVVQVSSYTSDEAIELIKDNAPLIVSYFEQAERDRVIGNALREYVYQDILIYKYTITEKDPFSTENIIARRNEAMKENVPGMFENSYMTTSPVLEPLVEHVRYRNLDFMQTRGLWEVENDYMGGPFVAHSFYSQDGKDMIVTEAFVYAPRYDKRLYMLQAEALLYSWEWAQKDEKEQN